MKLNKSTAVEKGQRGGESLASPAFGSDLGTEREETSGGGWFFFILRGSGRIAEALRIGRTTWKRRAGMSLASYPSFSVQPVGELQVGQEEPVMGR